MRTLLVFAALSAAGANLEHTQWDAVLKEFVTTGSRVDYRRLKAQGLGELYGYLRQLASPWPDGMPSKARKAALILARYAPPEAREALTDPAQPIEYKRYDWGLNDTSAGAGYCRIEFCADWARNGYLAGAVTDWFFRLGRKHGVNPLVFGAIYVGAIPFFSISVTWLIRNIRRRRSVVGAALCASFCFVSAYLYLFVAGKNLPAWVYFFLLGMLVLGGYSAIRKIKLKLSEGGRA